MLGVGGRGFEIVLEQELGPSGRASTNSAVVHGIDV